MRSRCLWGAVVLLGLLALPATSDVFDRNDPGYGQAMARYQGLMGVRLVVQPLPSSWEEYNLYTEDLQLQFAHELRTRYHLPALRAGPRGRSSRTRARTRG
jgi:hypothetical protein